MIPRKCDPFGCLILLGLAILLALAALAAGCGPAPERHTWGELGFRQWSDESQAWVPLDEPIPPEVWEDLKRGRLEVAPEEPARTMPRERWLVWENRDRNVA